MVGRKGKRKVRGQPKERAGNVDGQWVTREGEESFGNLEDYGKPKGERACGDLEMFYGEDVGKLAQKGNSFLGELTRTQSFKKAKSAMGSFGRLRGGTGVGISQEREFYDASPLQYKESCE